MGRIPFFLGGRFARKPKRVPVGRRIAQEPAPDIVSALDRALSQTLAKHASTLDELYKLTGVEPLPSFASPEWERRSLSSWKSDVDRFRLAVAALEQRGPVVLKSDALRLADIDDSQTYRFDSVQDEIGAPGSSMIVAGSVGSRQGPKVVGIRTRIEVEQNGTMLPYLVRGSYGEPGLYEDMYRRDPGLFKHTNEIASLMCSATYEPNIPETADAELRDVIRRGHRAIMNVKGGFDRFKSDAATLIRNGFAPFEIVWQEQNGFYTPFKIGFREQSSVDYWIFDERQADLVGGEFRVTNGGQWLNYVLPHGDTPETARLLVINIGATGNNVEGVPAYRPIAGYFKLKLMLVQLFAIAWQKHGIPLATIVTDVVDATTGELGQLGTQEHKSAVAKLITRLQDLRARIAPVLPVPTGKRVEYLSPANQLPDLRPMLEYIDLMIALAFSNEGAMLGTQTGSYALALSKTESFMRSAPVYSQRICAGLDQLMRWIVKFNYSKADQLVEWPTYSFRFAGSQDHSRWTDDVAKGLPLVPNMPEAMRRMYANGLGLPTNTFDEPAAVAPLVPLPETEET